VPPLSVPPTPGCPQTATATKDNSAWKAYHWNRGVEKTRKELSEAEISTLNSLLAGGNSFDKAVDELRAKMPSYTGNRSTRAHRFQKFFQTFEKYGRVVDVCIQHSPEVTALVWGSMRLLLDVWLPCRLYPIFPDTNLNPSRLGLTIWILRKLYTIAQSLYSRRRPCVNTMPLSLWNLPWASSLPLTMIQCWSRNWMKHCPHYISGS
jgi:hypothetical protein